MVDRTLTTDIGEIELNLMTMGAVPESAMDQAEEEIRSVLDRTPDPVLFARVKLIHDDNRTRDERAIAQATLDMSGTMIRAEVAAPSLSQALHSMRERLERNILDVAGEREARRQKSPRPPEGEWWSGAIPTPRPSYFPRPAEEREVIRHKTYAAPELTPEEAIFDMRAMDYRFLLFTERGTGEESIVYEADGGELMFQRASGREPDEDALTVPVELNPAPAPELDLEAAERFLDEGGQAFVFFRDAEEGHARVLYRRLDGHYGLIELRRET